MIYLLAYLLNVFDAFATWKLFTRYGIEIESNPVGRWLIENDLMWWFKLFVVGWLIAFLYAKSDSIASSIGVRVVVIVYACICIQHVILFIVTW